MKLNLFKQVRLALTGLVLAGSAGLAVAQAPLIDWTYDSSATSVPFQFWFGNNTCQTEWNGNWDAATNPASGSLEFDVTWNNDQWCNWTGFSQKGGWDNSVSVNLDLYQSESFDIRVDTGSAGSTGSDGNFGRLDAIANIQWGQITLGTFVIPGDATNNWYHVVLPLAKGLGSAWGPGFIQAAWEHTSPPSGSQVTFYIDNLSFNPSPPNVAINNQPLNEEVFAGENIALSVGATGGQPLAYQWYKGNSPLANAGNITGATNSVLHIANTSASDVTNYFVVITNSVNSVTSSNVWVSVLAAPGDPFAATTKALKPATFYELNETNDPSTGTLGAFDHVGGYVGLYQSTVSNEFDGYYGPSLADGYTNLLATHGAAFFPGNNAKITVPPLNLNTASATFAAWINPAGGQPYAAPIALCRAGSTVAGFVYYNPTDLGYNWANDGNTWNWDSGIQPPVGQWSFVVLVVTPADATIYLFNPSTTAASPQVAVHTYAHPVQAFDGQTLIGQDQSSTGRTLNGSLDDVAIYGRALSLGEVTALYASASGELIPPTITQQPSPVSLFAGTHAPAVFTVGAYAAPLATYHWQKVGGTLGANASGVNTPTLTISNLTAADVGQYEVTIVNSGGTTNSAPANLSLISSPTGAYAQAVVALNPVAFYELNETGDPSQGGLPAIDNWGGLNGTYGVVVQDGFNSIAGPLPANGYGGFTANNNGAAFSAQSANFADNVVSLPSLGINTANATFTAWINPSASTTTGDGNTLQTQYAGLLFSRSSSPAGLAWTGISTNPATAGDSTLGFDWGGNFWSWDSEVTVPAGVWSFVALSVTPTNVTVSVYTTNQITRSTFVASVPAVGINALNIGGDANNNNRIFNGTVDDVAIFNQTLTWAQLNSLAGIGGATSLVFVKGSQLTWYQGTLLQSASLNGPWTAVPGATSPYTLPLTGPAKFYRVLVSN